MIYTLIRDKPIISEILDLILIDEKNYQIIRNDKNAIRIYYKISDNEKIYFDIYYPSQYQLNELKKERN